MQTTWNNQVFGLEPYEELQSGFVSVEGDSQADALSPPGMIPSSTPISKSPKKSLFSRKPVTRTSTDGPPPPSSTTNALSSDQPSAQDSPTETLHAPIPFSGEPSSDAPLPLSTPNRSIIPESLKELPSWYHTEGELAAATTRQFRGRYPIHNPVGPRFYKNVHLQPSNRPASVFSRSFPPMPTEAGSTPSPSRTPSGTPLPTPSSSETRIPDPTGKGRTRKISNVADNVDLLDASDPYGTNWHHESPYDGLGLNADRNPVSPDLPDARPSPRSRSRMSTQPPGTYHRTTAPSPLSQSTSAVHLHSTDQDAPPPVAITRRLTKRRKPFEGIFGSSSSAPTSDTASTTLSIAGSSQTVTSKIFKRQSIFKSASTSSIAASVVPSEKRQKHSSLLGRFARRLSIIRRPGHSRGGSFDASNDGSRRQSLQVTDRNSTTTRPPSFASPVSPSENPQSTRVPPPQARTTPSPDSTPLGTPDDERTGVGEQTQDGKRDSMSSLEVSYSIGRLTVANPDVPSSVDDSPVNQTHPLPASRTTQASAPLPPRGREKPLPPPVPPSSPVFLEVPKFESLSALMPPPNGVATTGPAAPTSRAPSGEDGQKLQSRPPSSLPVPIPRPVKSEKRATASSPPSAKPVPASAPVSPPTHPPTGRVSVSAPPAIDDSPLSRASIIANPPTPYVEPTRINSPPVKEQVLVSSVHQPIPSPVITPIVSSPHPTSPRESQTLPLHESSQTKNQVSRVNSSVRSRQTETFHLVRNPSAGAVPSTGESIIVAGEQWDVVGGRQRARTKKEKEDAKRANSDQERRDPKRQDRMTIEKAPPVPLKSESRKSRTKDSSSSRHRTSQTESKEVRRSPTVPSPRVSGVPSPKRTPERRLSQSQGPRPTSELTPAAEMNALRAREVWEMDRLWKGRSVAYGLEGPQVVYAQSIGDVGSTTSVNGVNHGSTNTSYKLQQGFPFPTAGVHSPPSSSSSLRPPQHHQQPRSFTHTMQGSMYDFPSGVRSYPDLENIPSIGSPESTPSTPTRNPLPAPPRQSTFRPTPLPASFAEKDDSATAEYWNKYAGVSVVSPTH